MIKYIVQFMISLKSNFVKNITWSCKEMYAVVNFDALAQASDRRQVVFLC